MTAVCLGAHVLDVLARPVTEIPEGQGGALVEEIRLAPAGSAGGTAVTLAKLDARVLSMGAVGDDPLADALLVLLAKGGVDTSHLVRKPGVQTSASVLPIRPNGDRPALHVIGANSAWTEDDVPWDAIESATHVHAGAPEIAGPELCAKVLERARASGATTSADLLADGNPGILEWVAPALGHVDHLLINGEQATGLVEEPDVAAACDALRGHGPATVAATVGADGAVVASAGGVDRTPAHPVEVVDTSGCGDAFSAGYLRGLAAGRPIPEAAAMGCAAATFVAGGLGSDAGDFDLAAVERLAFGDREGD
ncbi:MAG TPA: PfkB family carbohydrate kinase [Thermoleophilaceae bacterium]|jgi:sugar/nucleoside kinase (ribokinase family)